TQGAGHHPLLQSPRPLGLRRREMAPRPDVTPLTRGRRLALGPSFAGSTKPPRSATVGRCLRRRGSAPAGGGSRVIAYWLVKSEPDDWSWAQQVANGAKGAEWTGIRNHQAQKNLRAMKKGDRAFFYHTGKERAIVGIVSVIAEAHPDSTDRAWRAIDVA